MKTRPPDSQSFPALSATKLCGQRDTWKIMWRLTLRVSVICATTVERVSRRGTVAISTSTHIIETQEESMLGSEDTCNHAIEIKWLVHIEFLESWDLSFIVGAFISGDCSQYMSQVGGDGMTKATSWQCHICSKLYVSKNAMEDHIRGVHLGTQSTYSCQFCGKHFQSRNSRSGHISKHHKSNSS